MLRQTPLHELHIAEGARMVAFAGWHMPVHYGSQIEEHRRVRRGCGLFDVSHMLAVDIAGPDAATLLRRVVANDPDRLGTAGAALYGCMLNELGGVIDDLLLYRLGEQAYRMVVNAGTRDKDVDWLRSHARELRVTVEPRGDLALLAVQGPRALEIASAALDWDLRPVPPFHIAMAAERAVARTGYTGEDGIEIMLPADAAAECWRRLRHAGAAPCGLGARDTLRLEAGLLLYGQDLDEETSPLESGLAWTVAFEPRQRDFIGRQALLGQLERGLCQRSAGVVLLARGVMRAGETVHTAAGSGRVTSGGYSPELEHSIGLVRVPTAAAENGEAEVEMRGRRLPARLVQPPFVRRGRVMLTL